MRTTNQVGGARLYRDQVGGTRLYRDQVGGARLYRDHVGGTRLYRDQVGGARLYRDFPSMTALVEIQRKPCAFFQISIAVLCVQIVRFINSFNSSQNYLSK